MRRLLALMLACTPEVMAPPAPLPVGPLGCGVIDMPCNCGGTIAYNWKVSPSARCASGLHIYYQCQATCRGGGWESACWCDGAADARH